MDAFFASIEIARNPALKGKPVIIGGLPNQRGVVSTCSYEARAFGVHSAMSLFEAKKRCPKGIFIPGDYSLYKEYSEKIFQIFFAFTPYVEMVSIDEAYLDLTEEAEKYGGANKLGILIKEMILKQTALPCSLGIATNKMVAKIAASFSKPNGFLEIQPKQEAAFLAPLPIHYLPGVGEKTEAYLKQEGFYHIQDFQKCSLQSLLDKYGGSGYNWYKAAFGNDERPVEWEDQAPKSIGAETTFDQDLSDIAIFRQTLHELCEKVLHRMEKHQMRARALSVKLRYSDFRTITRSHTFETHLNRLERIYPAAERLLTCHYDGSLPLRLIGVSLEKLNDGYWQPTFWENQ